MAGHRSEDLGFQVKGNQTSCPGKWSGPRRLQGWSHCWHLQCHTCPRTLPTGQGRAASRDLELRGCSNRSVVCGCLAPAPRPDRFPLLFASCRQAGRSFYCSDANSTAFKFPMSDANVTVTPDGKAQAEVPLDGTVYGERNEFWHIPPPHIICLCVSAPHSVAKFSVGIRPLVWSGDSLPCCRQTWRLVRCWFGVPRCESHQRRSSYSGAFLLSQRQGNGVDLRA